MKKEDNINFEEQYQQSLIDTLDNGVYMENRTGVSTFMKEHQFLRSGNVMFNFPMLKGKKVYPKLALKELMWMLNGRTDVKWLEERGVKYWNEWADKDGTIGKSYGHQMRNFNGCDNFKMTLLEMSKNPLSRRLMLNLWNPNDLSEMTLPPCVFQYQFICTPIKEKPKKDGEVRKLFPEQVNERFFSVNLHVTARSEDSFIGMPYDIMFASWMLMVMCELANQESNISNGEFVFRFMPNCVYYTSNNYHLYDNHIKQMKTYISNVEENQCNVINQKVYAHVKQIQDYVDLDTQLKRWDDNQYKDFVIEKYFEDQYFDIKAPIAI